MDNKTATLKVWALNKNPRYIVGEIHGDTHERWADGTRIRTSTVTEISGDGRFATTLNSIYELQPPYKEKK